MLVLIDTWWNVNLGAITIEETKAPVLIDTWWNVNLGDYSIDTFYNGVLIDTWWNVNHIKDIPDNGFI